MNAANSMRASLHGLPSNPKANEFRPPVNTKDRRRTFHPVDYAAQQTYYAKEKETQESDVVWDVEWEDGGTATSSRVGEQMASMFTKFPIRDANWLIAVMAFVGSVSFTFSAFLGLLPLTNPETAFTGEVGVALPLTYAIGSILFVSASALTLVALWNLNKRIAEELARQDSSKVKPEVPFKPKDIGRSSWVWLPSPRGVVQNLPATPLRSAAINLKTLLSAPFLSTAMHLAGGLILFIGTVTRISQVDDPTDTTAFATSVAGPLLVGGGFFTIANAILVPFYQEKWYLPNFFHAGWQAAVWSTAASFCFSYAGFLLSLSDVLAAAVAFFIGSWGFLAGSVFHWYDVMAYHLEEQVKAGVSKAEESV
ncbi:hypothetical protein F5Y15DRAFT_374395 [Xylariaceae sp. FL0016]|nr:hypothetical protein F5Y15DRAFT_374395 [Xylariaceae sp. FL0016]